MITCAIHRFLHRNCKKTSEDKTEKVELVLSEHIAELKDLWSSLSIPDIFLQYPYLSILEKYANPNVKPYYVIIKSNGKAIACFLFQLTEFDFIERLPEEVLNNSIVKKFLNKKLSYSVLIHGNLYLSGKHMNYFTDTSISEPIKSDYILDVMDELNAYLQESNVDVNAFLVKDKDLGDQPDLEFESESKFSRFCVDPNMILPLSTDWNTMDDYLSDVKSKYRVRYRKARSHKKELSYRELSDSDILMYKERMHELYKMTATEADFNMGFFDQDYFYQLKKELGDSCLVFAYFDQDVLIAFFTCIINLDTFSAHFLGFDKKYNKSHKLYLNILYDIVDLGIQSQSQEIYFSRTALEIKSTIGAVAHDLHCYIKLDNRIKNKLLPYIIPKVITKPEWTARSPFKKQP